MYRSSNLKFIKLYRRVHSRKPFIIHFVVEGNRIKMVKINKFESHELYNTLRYDLNINLSMHGNVIKNIEVTLVKGFRKILF